MIIDVDLHHEVADWAAVAAHGPAGLRWRIARPNGPPLARNGYKMVGSAPAPPAIDPGRVKAELIEPRSIDRAILTGSLLSLGVQPYPDLSAALATAVNDWTLATWLRPYPCFKGSILIAQQDPLQAAAEIDRLGDQPGMVQVLMGSAAEAPFGRRQYHPIYAACVRHDLPLALHLGGEGTGIAQPSSGVGHPTSYFEWYADLPQNYMAHLVSMVCEGVFERFPTLKLVLYEGGIFWLPHLMWRFDKNWKGQRGDVPWVKEPPSHYLRRHLWSTLYPLEEARQPAQLERMLRLVDAEHRLLFATNYPHWEYGDPFEQLSLLPSNLHQRVLADNALALYGKRLLAAN
jgi:predicted TIM-barrel fold metal-dependent hydrolase